MMPWQVQVAAGTMAKPRLRQNADGSWDFTISGVNPQTLWSPLQPMPPGAQDPAMGAIGRQFDYLVGSNINYVPRSTESIGFNQLRALAENLDVLRLVIETRKDQMEALEWTVQGRDKNGKAKADDVLKFLEYPDRIHNYSEWMRFLLEERFVTDALCIYPRMTNGGQLYSLDLMDGTLIKPLCDATGRRPAPPDPAYQQVIKGIPAVDYTAEELIYKPGNGRVWKFYGYSPVEQLVFTVNMALRREMSKLDYYTQGSIPDAFGLLPDGYSPAQVKEWQAYWDNLFENPAGDNFVRRQMRWIPNVKDIKFPKDQILKDEFDEWLARKVCYAFSVEPTPFVKMMNRAVAETQKEQSRSEGLLPLKKSWKSLMDYIIAFHLKRPDLEFIWKDEETVDPVEKMKVDVGYVNGGVLLANEVRADLGRDKAPQPGMDAPRLPTTVTLMTSEDPDDAAEAERQAQQDQAAAAAARLQAGPAAEPGKPGEPAAGSAGAGNAPPGKGGAAAAKPAGAAKPAAKILSAESLAKIAKIKPRRGVNQRNEMKLAKKLTAALRALGHSVADQLVEALNLGKDTPTKVKPGASNANKAVDDLDLSVLNQSAYDDLAFALKDSADDGGFQALTQVGMQTDDITNLANERAEKWAAERAGELITSDADGGELADSTRDMIRNTVLKAEEAGASNETLRQELMDQYAFSPERAALIAKTELKFADSAGAMIGYRASGVVTKKVWQESNEGNVCDECQENVDAGEIDLDEDFPSGDDAPPAHPGCNCVVVPIVEDEEA